jgi:hypothetical protein
MGYRQPSLERFTRNDKLERFRTRGWPDKFWGNETTIFLDDEVVSSGVNDSHTGFKGRRNPPKTTIWVPNFAQKHNHNIEPSQKGFYDGYEIISCYAQSNNITPEQQNPIMTSIQS